MGVEFGKTRSEGCKKFQLGCHFVHFVGRRFDCRSRNISVNVRVLPIISEDIGTLTQA